MTAPPAVSVAGTADARASDTEGSRRHERLLAALALQLMFADERVAAVSGGRAKRPSRTGDEGRRRPRELVRREKGLRRLVATAGSLS